MWHDFVGPDVGTRPLLLLNEMTANHESWQWVLPLLGDQARVILADTPGTGRSPLPEPVTLTAMAEGVAALLDSAGVDQVDIAGAGYSAAVVAHFAALYPERVASIMLITIAAEIPAELAAMMRLAADQIESVGLEPFAEAILAGSFPVGFAERRPDIYTSYRDLLLARDPKTFAAMQRCLADAGPAVGEHLRKIRCRVAVVGGSDDRAFSPEVHAVVGRLIDPPVEPSIVEGAAHFPWCQNPPAMAATIREFFGTGVESSARPHDQFTMTTTTEGA